MKKEKVKRRRIFFMTVERMTKLVKKIRVKRSGRAPGVGGLT